MKLKTVAIIIAAAGLYGCSDPKPTENKAAAALPHYQLVNVQGASMEQSIKLPAQLAAYQEVSIFPKVNGYVKNVAVDIGSHVNKGQLLLSLDAPEILQASLQAKERYERAKSDFMLNKENYFRLKVASATAGAISPMDLATAHAKMQSDSALTNAENANWQIQRQGIAYLQVTAPFNGIITDRNIHPGALVSAEGKDSKPMLELKEVDHLRLQVDIPENVSANLKVKDQLDFYLSAMPGKKMSATISRKAGNVNIQYRTERVELDVPNKSGVLSPGMYADVILEAKGNPGAMVVPKSAVVTSTERKYVIAVRNDKTIKVDVSTGIESNNRIEVSGDLKTGDRVVANANDEIEEGINVK